MEKFANWLTKEVKALLPVWLFFLGAFALLALTQSVTLEKYGVHRETPPLVLAGSLIVAKVFLVADHRRFANRYANRPLIYGILWKTGIYFFFVYVVWYIEQLIELMLKKVGFVQASQRIFERINSPVGGVTLIWVVLLMFGFLSIREVIRALGKPQFMRMFFGMNSLRPPKTQSEQTHKPRASA